MAWSRKNQPGWRESFQRQTRGHRVNHGGKQFDRLRSDPDLQTNIPRQRILERGELADHRNFYSAESVTAATGVDFPGGRNFRLDDVETAHAGSFFLGGDAGGGVRRIERNSLCAEP